MTQQNCKHYRATAKVSVHRGIDGGPRMANVKIRCADCGEPFEFLGVETEGPTDRPSVDVKAQDLRVPIAVRNEVEPKTTKKKIQ